MKWNLDQTNEKPEVIIWLGLYNLHVNSVEILRNIIECDVMETDLIRKPQSILYIWKEISRRKEMHWKPGNPKQ